MSDQFLQTGFSRLFAIPYRAGPRNAPLYQGLWRAGAVSWGQGDVTLVRNPDPSQYDQFKVVGKYRGAPGNPELPVIARFTRERSELLKLVRSGCDHDIQVHIGTCENPQDFARGWASGKVLVLEAASPTNYSTGDVGALDPSERAVINETVPFQGEDYYELTPLTFARKADTQVTREIMDIVACDAASCGACGLPSDGCQVIFAVMKNGGASPGILNELIFTDDGGRTWDVSTISALSGSETPNALRCIGQNVIVVSGDNVGLVYADISDILEGSGTWTEVTTGFVAAAQPQSLWSANPAYTWLVGKSGYVYFTSDPTAGVDVQDAGVATTQALNDIHGVDVLNIVAVGDSNAVIKTNNGGLTWEAITGPAAGINLKSVHMQDANNWWVTTANGKLYYTTDAGDNWTEKTFSGSGAGVAYDVTFVNKTVGYLAHTTATPSGRIFRTIDGGYSWYVLPEAVGSIPANQRINRIATCPDPNIVFGGGLASGGTDGIIVQGA